MSLLVTKFLKLAAVAAAGIEPTTIWPLAAVATTTPPSHVSSCCRSGASILSQRRRELLKSLTWVFSVILCYSQIFFWHDRSKSRLKRRRERRKVERTRVRERERERKRKKEREREIRKTKIERAPGKTKLAKFWKRLEPELFYQFCILILKVLYPSSSESRAAIVGRKS